MASIITRARLQIPFVRILSLPPSSKPISPPLIYTWTVLLALMRVSGGGKFSLISANFRFNDIHLSNALT
jgi:hypothetical protein